MTYAESTHASIPPVAARLACFAGPAAIRVVGIVVFDHFSLVEAAEIAEIFDRANQIRATSASSAPLYRTAFYSSSGEPVSSSSRIAVLAKPLPESPAVRALFIAGGDGIGAATHDARLKAWLPRAHANATTVWPIGNGGALLRAAGLAERHASADAAAEASSSGDAGSEYQALSSAMRVALDIVQHDLGPQVARRIVNALTWPGLAKPASVVEDSTLSTGQRVRAAARWIAEHCDRRVSVMAAAQVADMSERSFLRHFSAEMGMKPSDYLRHVRLELASALLVESDLPVDKIARRCGMTSGQCLARAFRQTYNISPTEYRTQRHATGA